MSEGPEKPRRSVLEGIRSRLHQIAMQKAVHDTLPDTRKWLDARVLAGTLSKERADELFAQFQREWSAPPEPTADELDVVAFINRLKNRQGNIEPDYGALYKRKTELDRDSP